LPYLNVCLLEGSKRKKEKPVAVPQGASSLIGRQRARKQKSKRGIQIPSTGRCQCAERPNVRRSETGESELWTRSYDALAEPRSRRFGQHTSGWSNLLITVRGKR
jgi:hypothetical protein